ncbi:MAG: tetratricopeptide repeat protein [Oscillatoriales cyanobacterium RM2_1_1]|nr:tetratricopeptide repeat protein [Oscillatoriales cyanobacterium RM2_1_1]
MATLTEALQLAISDHRANHFTRAERTYAQILEKQPHNADALYGLGVLTHQIGKYQLAEHLFNQLLKLHPDSARGWLGLGNLYQSQGQFSEAITAYQNVLEIQPDSVAAYNNLGYALQQQGKLEEAIARYQTALEFQPDCQEAEVNLGNIFHALGQLSPENQLDYGIANCNLGITCQYQGDLKTARQYYHQAIALNPNLAKAYSGLGAIYQKQDQLELAEAAYHKALELDPEDGEVYLSLGKLYQTQRQLMASASAYRQGLCRVNPAYAAALKAYQPLNVPPEERLPPEVSMGEVTIGGHSFPTVSPVPTDQGKRPFWTVIVPLYNRQEFMLECLASLLRQWQGEEHMEILVMDNNSHVPMFELVEAIGGGVVQYYRNPQNIGARRNFNLGIALSRGQWVQVLPDDEYVLPDFYKRLQQSLGDCPDSVGAAFTGYQNIDDREEVIFVQYHPGLQPGINSNWLERIGVSNPLNPCAVVIRRTTHEQLGVYDPANNYTPDWELYKRIAAFQDWWHESGVLACYRQHSNNMSTEMFLAGAQGDQYRLGIEMSAGYLPAEVVARSRRHYFDLCLKQAAIPLKAGKMNAVFRLIQAALKIDSSPEAAQKLFAWLASDGASPVRTVLVEKLSAMPFNDSSETKDFFFAYP